VCGRRRGSRCNAAQVGAREPRGAVLDNWQGWWWDVSAGPAVSGVEMRKRERHTGTVRGRRAGVRRARVRWFCRGSTSSRETRDVAHRVSCRGAYVSQAGRYSIISDVTARRVYVGKGLICFKLSVVSNKFKIIIIMYINAVSNEYI
jgi:hypothetical protein